MSTISKKQAIAALMAQVARGEDLVPDRQDPILSAEDANNFETQARHWVEKIFGAESSQLMRIASCGPPFRLDTSHAVQVSDRLKRHKARLQALASMIETLEDELSLEDDSAAAPTTPDDPSRLRTVFIVHGHDEAMRLKVSALLEKLSIEWIVLQDELSRGRTVIEKFEGEARRAGFAVILASPDDVGGKDAGEDTELRARARQNVVFEMGYFMSQLGRGQVCLLKKGDVEIVSDLAGVIYVSFDAGWELKLVKVMRGADVEADWDALTS